MWFAAPHTIAGGIYKKKVASFSAENALRLLACARATYLLFGKYHLLYVSEKEGKKAANR